MAHSQRRGTEIVTGASAACVIATAHVRAVPVQARVGAGSLALVPHSLRAGLPLPVCPAIQPHSEGRTVNLRHPA
jgi:hypothetical protein